MGDDVSGDRKRRTTTLRERMRARVPLAGLFLRSSDHRQVEVIGGSGLDMVCLDAEHSVFDRGDIDRCVLAASNKDIPCLVRVAKLDSACVSQALDLGASGVIVPHVRSATEAGQLAKMSRYGPGGRGFASSCRSADYGALDRAAIIDRSDRQTCVIAMLEDPEAFDDLDGVVATPGIDGFFIGKADLSVAMGVCEDSAEIEGLIDRACDAARRHEKALGMVLRSAETAAAWLERGMTFFLISSDYQLIGQGAARISQDFIGASGDR